MVESVQRRGVFRGQTRSQRKDAAPSENKGGFLAAVVCSRWYSNPRGWFVVNCYAPHPGQPRRAINVIFGMSRSNVENWHFVLPLRDLIGYQFAERGHRATASAEPGAWGCEEGLQYVRYGTLSTAARVKSC